MNNTELNLDAPSYTEWGHNNWSRWQLYFQTSTEEVFFARGIAFFSSVKNRLTR